MNYIKHLTGFFDRVIQDNRLNPTHISLYISLFQFWNVARFKNPISISRDEVMRISKISSKATYHKCMKDLHTFGYLNYDPSFNPFRGSHITIFDLEISSKEDHKKQRSPPNFLSVTEQVLNPLQTGDEQALVPYTNNSNKTNKQNKTNEYVHSTEKINSGLDLDPTSLLTTEGQQRKKIASKKESSNPRPQRPVLQTVSQYFADRSWPALEGEKFFYHYQSNGWFVGGQPMEDWQASAEKWILNSNNFNNNDRTREPRPGKLNAARNKNYGEPL